MKKIIKICAAALISAFIFTSCSAADYSGITGYDIIKTAKEKYAALESGHLVITDNSDGKITQDFIFKYEGDTMVYSYIGSDDTLTYYEYHNGSELDYCDSTSTQWSYLDSASEGYYVYTKTDRNSLTTDSIIALNPDSIVSGEISENEKGETVLHYTYSVEKLNANSSSISQLGTLKSFETTFIINTDGFCTEMNQVGIIVNGSEEAEVNYTMTITETNSVEKVTRPEAVFPAV